jgi:hypothetical protein
VRKPKSYERRELLGASLALAATAVVLFVLPNSAATASGEAHAQHPARPASVAQSLGVGISRHGIALSGRF